MSWLTPCFVFSWEKKEIPSWTEQCPLVPRVLKLSMPAAWFQAVGNYAHLLMGETRPSNPIVLCRSKLSVTLNLHCVPFLGLPSISIHILQFPMRRKTFPQDFEGPSLGDSEDLLETHRKALRGSLQVKSHSKVVLS